MKTLLINNISIIDGKNKVARYCEFSKGINVVTSDAINTNGNWVGKSSLLRSIFHTLGANACFNGKWEQEGKYSYILDFSIENDSYSMLRFDGLFKLFSKNRLLFSVVNRDDLALKLKEVFGYGVYLMNQKDKYVLAAPVFNYLINYIEQTQIKCCGFSSFNNLSAYKDWYVDLLYNLMGVNNEEYNNLKQQINVDNQKLEALNKKQTFLNEMLKQLSSKESIPVSSIKAVEIEMKKYEKEYGEITEKINKVKSKLYALASNKKDLERIIKDLNNQLVYGTKNIKKLMDCCCPLCNSEISDNGYSYFKVAKENNSIEFEILSLAQKLEDVKRGIELEQGRLMIESEKLTTLEKSIQTVNKEADEAIRFIGVKKIKENILNELTGNMQSIDSLNLSIINAKKRIRELDKVKKSINIDYHTEMLVYAQKYNIKAIESRFVQKIESKFNPADTTTNITTVIWLCVLLKLKYKYNKSSLVFPLIFDNPNNADFAKNNVKDIFNVIFSNLPSNGQIITSLVGFNRGDYPEYEIHKVITLTEQYHLLNKNDYAICEQKLRTLLNK